MEKLLKINTLPKPILTVGKLIISVLFYYGLYYLFISKDGNLESLKYISKLSNFQQFIILFCLILGIPNWLLETQKWQISLFPVEKLSFKTALDGVLRGIPLAIFTPNRVGEIFGRSTVLKSENRASGALATLYNGFAQMPIMMFSAFLGLLWFRFGNAKFVLQTDFLIANWFIVIVFICSSLMLCVYFCPQKFIPFARKAAEGKGFVGKLEFFSRYTSNQKLKIIVLSILRYLVYCFQNYLLLIAFGVDIQIVDAMLGIFIVYFLMSFIPRPALAEFGVRCSFSILVFGNAVENYSSLVFSSALLWIINLLIPSILSWGYILMKKNCKKIT